MTVYRVRKKNEEIFETRNRTQANNVAFHENTYFAVIVPSKGIVKTVRPKKLILNNLIDQGFHNHYNS